MMTKLEAEQQVLHNLITYLDSANQRYVYPNFNEQQIKKLVKVSNVLKNKAEKQLNKVQEKLDLISAS